METLTQPDAALNHTALFVSIPPGQEIPNYTVLEEAMENQTGFLHETGNVNELLIENPGDTDLFIQAGDIVKGGWQDRTLGADFIVPATSGKVAIPFSASRWPAGTSGAASQTHISGLQNEPLFTGRSKTLVVCPFRSPEG